MKKHPGIHEKQSLGSDLDPPFLFPSEGNPLSKSQVGTSTLPDALCRTRKLGSERGPTNFQIRWVEECLFYSKTANKSYSPEMIPAYTDRH